MYSRRDQEGPQDFVTHLFYSEFEPHPPPPLPFSFAGACWVNKYERCFLYLYTVVTKSTFPYVFQIYYLLRQQTILFQPISNKVSMESVEFGLMWRRFFWFLSSVVLPPPPSSSLRVWAKPSQLHMHVILLAYFEMDFQQNTWGNGLGCLC